MDGHTVVKNGGKVGIIGGLVGELVRAWRRISAEPDLVALAVLATLLGACTSGARGTDDPVRGPVTVEVRNATTATLVSIQLTPAAPSVPVIVDEQLTATGIYSDGSKKALAGLVWTVSDPTVATVDDDGLVTPVAPGTLTVTASDPGTLSDGGELAASISLTVTSATLVSMAVTPASKQIPIGTTQNFTATGTFSDSTKFALPPSAVTWTTTDPAIATVASAGGATGVGEGVVEVIATNGPSGLSAHGLLTIGTATLVSLAVTPSTSSIPKGLTQAFDVVGTYSDDSTFDLTEFATWSSSAGAVASISNASGSIGVATGKGVGTATITATVAGVKGTADLTVTAALLESIAVTPLTATLPNGSTEQLTATGTYSDGTTKNITKSVTWMSGAPGTVSVSNATGSDGLATALALGATTVVATDPTTGVANTATITVTAAVLKTLAVTPATASLALGPATKSYTATGTFTNGTTQNMTATVLWTSSTPAVATISNAAGSAGVASSLSVGATSITAYDPVSGLTSKAVTLKVTAATLTEIQINPLSVSIPEGFSEQFTATGLYSDGSTQNLTSTVTWKVTAGAATISNAAGSQGLASTTAAGTSTIQAVSGTIKATASLKATTATLQSISVTPPSPSIAVGTSQQFTATGTFSDGTTLNMTSLVLWVCGPDASISNAAGSQGLATALAAGYHVGISAQYGSIYGSAELNTTPATLVSIAVTPGTSSIPAGTTEQFVATGTYTDGTTQNLPNATWSTSTSSVLAISPTGLGTALYPGVSVVTATDPTTGISGGASVTVTGAILVGIAINPSSANLPLGTFQQLTAVGNYSDGSSRNLTNSVTWSTSNGSVSVANAPAVPPGLASSLSIGTTVVTATDSTTGIAGAATLTATAAALVSIAVTPATQSVPSGLTQQYDAVGTYTDGSTMDITQSATWTTSGPSASISNAAGSNGLATAGVLGTATIIVTDPTTGIQGSATLTSTAALLASIAVSPASPNIPAGLSAQLTATGFYTDGSSLNLTSSVTWTASGNATVSNATGSWGVVVAGSVGSATVVATDPTTGIAGAASVTVTAAILESLVLSPASVSLLTGQTQQLSATGTMSDGSSVDYTGAVTWTSSASSVYVSTGGLVTGVSVGSGLVTGTDPVTGIVATANVSVALNTNDDVALEFSPYVNPVGNWSFGWESAPGAGFNLDTSSYSGAGDSAWYGVDPQGYAAQAAENESMAATSFDAASLSPGQLALLPPSLATDTSHADARWTAPAAGTYQVTATFTGTSACFTSSYYFGFRDVECVTQTGTVSGPCAGGELGFAYPGEYYEVGDMGCTQPGNDFVFCPTGLPGGTQCLVYRNYFPSGCQCHGALGFPYGNSDCDYISMEVQEPNYGCIPSTTDVDVLQNGSSVFAGYVNLNGAGNVQTYTATLTLNAGDTLDFEAGNGGNQNNYDMTILTADVQAICSGSACAVVTNANDSGSGSLRDVVANAPGGATVTFAPDLNGQTITVLSPISIGSSMTISGPGASLLTISGGGTQGIFSLVGSNANTFSGLTLADGNASNGGAIAGSAIPLTVTDCVFLNNQASGYPFGEGGAVHYSGVAVFTNVVFNGNSAAYTGGALMNGGGGDSLTMNNVQFFSNSATYGAALAWVSEPLASITNAVFAGNGAYRGGGIFTQGGRLAVTNTDFIGNSDGIYALGEYLTLDNVSISNSTSDAMTITNGGTTTVTYCDFWNNGATPFSGMSDPTGTSGNITASPLFADVSESDPSVWNLQLQPGSPLINAGDPAILNANGTQSDIGYYGGPGAP